MRRTGSKLIARAVLAVVLVVAACSSGGPDVVTQRPDGTGIAAAPLTPRERVAVTWTGDEAVLLGGQAGWKTTSRAAPGGAAYDPERDSWRVLPDAAVLHRRGVAAVTVDGRVLVWGGESGCASEVCPSEPTGAVLDLASNTWTPLRPGPGVVGLSDATAVTACGRVFFGAGGTGDGPARTPALVTADARGGGWRTLALGEPIYDLSVGTWGVPALTLLDGRATLHVVDPCTGETRISVPAPGSGVVTGVWLEAVGDRVWLGRQTGDRVGIHALDDPRSGWRHVADVSVEQMPMPSTTADARPGWSGVHGDTVVAVTGTGIWTYDTSRDRLTRLRTGPKDCGAGAAAALVRDRLLVRGGQSCSPEGPVQTRDGILLRL